MATLTVEELTGMLDDILDMAPIQSIMSALAQTCLRKEAYAKKHWPDKPETFMNHGKYHSIVTRCLGEMDTLGREMEIDARSKRAALLEEVIKDRAEQDAILLAAEDKKTQEAIRDFNSLCGGGNIVIDRSQVKDDGDVIITCNGYKFSPDQSEQFQILYSILVSSCYKQEVIDVLKNHGLGKEKVSRNMTVEDIEKLVKSGNVSSYHSLAISNNAASNPVVAAAEAIIQSDSSRYFFEVMEDINGVSTFFVEKSFWASHKKIDDRSLIISDVLSKLNFTEVSSSVYSSPCVDGDVKKLHEDVHNNLVRLGFTRHKDFSEYVKSIQEKKGQ